MAEQLTINIEDLNLGAFEFIENFSGTDYETMLRLLEAGEGMPLKALMAVIACSLDPLDPESAMSQVRKMKISEVDLGVKS